MLEKHMTKDGEGMLIAQMSDEHLANFIGLICRQISNRRQMAQTADIVDDYQRKLYNVEKVDADEAARQNRMAFKLLYPYLAEAFVRDMQDVRQTVIGALGRTSRIEGVSVGVLPENIDDILEDAFNENRDIDEDVDLDSMPF